MRFRYQNVCVEGFGYTLPEEIVTSAQLEAMLTPLYRRLRLPEGRLELMTGIRERRFWPRGMLPSVASVASAEKAIAATGIDKSEIGALIHASVCRDFVEPATACGVHARLGLPVDCLVYDVSNACLGILNGMVQVANMIELGQIRAGVVVGTESGRQLVESTVAELNSNDSFTRESVKSAVASLTIGSASVAVVLTDRELSRTGNRLLGGAARGQTEFHTLCHGGSGETAANSGQLLMTTNSERLMHEGVRAAVPVLAEFLDELGWTHDDIDKTFCHQIGVAHRRLMFEGLGLDTAIDFSTVETLGNTGSAALPITAAMGIEQGWLAKDDGVALLGIGSGINVLMLGMEWQGVANTGESGKRKAEIRRAPSANVV